MPAPLGKKQNRVNQDAYARVIAALLHEPQTLTMLEESTGLHRVTLQRLFRIFRKHKVVHISAWEQDSRGRDVFAVFTLGKGKDKQKFRMTREEIARRYREKCKRKKQMEHIDAVIRGQTHEIRSV